MSAPTSIFLVAGEASGDRLGAALIRGLRAELGPSVEIRAVGGAAMAAEGVESLFPIEDVAVMGLTEVAPRLPTILRRIRETRDAVVATRPEMLVTIDAPDFGLRVARGVAKAMGADRRPTLVHYVAPSVWAWRPKRADKLAKSVDHLLALLPFEPPYFERVGLACDVVGHPVVGAAAAAGAGDLEALRRARRAELDIADGTQALAILPGSRRGEVGRLGPIFTEALRLLIEEDGRRLAVITPVAETVARDVGALIDRWRGLGGGTRVHALAGAPRGATPATFAAAEARKLSGLAAADAALAASGTVSLELAAMGAPMVIGYKLSGLTAAIARRLLKVDTATLVNLVSETRAVPEFFQEACEPQALADALRTLLNAGPNDPPRAVQRAAAEATMIGLGRGAAPSGLRAARALLAAHARRASA